MSDPHRSGCPINLAIEAIGDKWSLIVIRDIMLGGRSRFRELLTQSLEGIASNILADRLKRLVAAGILTRADDPTHRQRADYKLTERGIALLPIIVQMGAWGRRHAPCAPELAERARLLEEGGPAFWDAFMDDLREAHLGPGHRLRQRPDHAYVPAGLEAAFERLFGGRA